MKRIAITVVLFIVVMGAATFLLWPGRRAVTELRMPGTVEIQEVRLGSRIAGRVNSVPVKESQIVEPGTILFTLEPFEWDAKRELARQRVVETKAALDKSNAGPLPEEVAEAKGAMEAAKARLDRVNAGFRDEQKRQAKADLDAAVADLTKAENDLDRVRKATVAVAPSELDLALAARDSAKGRVKSQQAVYDMMKSGSRAEDIDEAKADLARTTAHYQLLKRGTRDEDKAVAYAKVKEAEAELAETEVNYRETTVTAPEKCVIEVVSIRAGDLVTPGTPVIRVLRADDLWVKVFVPSTELGKLRLGQAASVTVDSHPGKTFPGEIISLASASEFTPRNVQSVTERRYQVFAVKVRVSDPDGVFKSGMAAEVVIPVAGQ